MKDDEDSTAITAEISKARQQARKRGSSRPGQVRSDIPMKHAGEEYLEWGEDKMKSEKGK